MCNGPHDFIPAPTTARLELVMQEHGQIIENVVYVQYPTSPSESDIRNLAQGAIGAWDATLATIMSDDVYLVKCIATDVSEPDSWQYEAEPAVLTQGHVAVAGLPSNVTVTTKFASGLSGRSQRGRAYWVGLTELQVTGNALVEGFALQISEQWGNFFATIAELDPSPNHVIVSYCHDGSWRTTAQVTLVSSYVTDPNTDSQRRRLNGRGA